MSPSDINRIQATSAPRPIDRDTASIASRPPRSDAGSSKASAAVKVETAVAFDAETPPVDASRVAEIRKALSQGNYPLVPAQIADAMIAAPLLLSTPE